MRHNKITSNIQKEAMLLLAAQVSHAVWMEDTSQLIASLATLVNYALDTGYVRDKKRVDWLDVVTIDAAVNVLFDIIEECAAGLTDSYSELYCLCTQLNCKILNGHTDPVFTQHVRIIHHHLPKDYS